jgi:hypothetical protein
LIRELESRVIREIVELDYLEAITKARDGVSANRLQASGPEQGKFRVLHGAAARAGR